MTNKIKFDNPLAIIINNTCNLTCNNCATAQCYNFKGVYNWKDTAEHYKKWAEIIDIPHIDILGGEPYLNPELLTWVVNIKNLWKNSSVNVISNGTLLFMDTHIETTRKFLDLDVCLLVCTHSAEDFKIHEQYILKILEPHIHEITIEIDEETKLVQYNRNNRTIIAHDLVNIMYQNYIKEVKDGVMYLSNSDPVESHKNCVWATMCSTIQNGLLYKCPLVTNYAAAKTQVKYEDRAVELLEEYRASSPFDDIQDIQHFIENINNVIPQCALCPYDKIPDAKEKLFPVTFDKSWKKSFKGVE